VRPTIVKTVLLNHTGTRFFDPLAIHGMYKRDKDQLNFSMMVAVAYHPKTTLGLKALLAASNFQWICAATNILQSTNGSARYNHQSSVYKRSNQMMLFQYSPMSKSGCGYLLSETRSMRLLRGVNWYQCHGHTPQLCAQAIDTALFNAIAYQLQIPAREILQTTCGADAAECARLMQGTLDYSALALAPTLAPTPT